MISIVDYGAVNLGSIRNMLRKLELDSTLASTPEAIRDASKLILPGVGAFDHGMAALVDRGLVEPLREKAIEERVPLLGICLGMQLLARSSEEGDMRGLGVLAGDCRRIRPPPGGTEKVPHMGWNVPSILRSALLVEDFDPKARFYFTHSYHLVCDDPGDVVATARHGIEFAAIVERDNVMGAQFHPEKSHRFGMVLLKNFGAI